MTNITKEKLNTLIDALDLCDMKEFYILNGSEADTAFTNYIESEFSSDNALTFPCVSNNVGYRQFTISDVKFKFID